MTRIVLLAAAAALAGCATVAPAPPPTAIARFDLAPSGTLRVAVFTANPAIGSKDAASGELRGTTVLLGRELAASAGVPVKFIEYTGAAKLLEDARGGAWDVAVVAFDPARRKLLDFAPPHLVDNLANSLCLALPRGRSAALDYVGRFVEHSKASGAVARAIERSGLRGVSVAPAAK